MDGLSPDLERLDGILLDLGDDAMMLSELDGFLTGVVICPEPIPPSEWLPVVWGRDDGTDEPIFASEDAAREVRALVMRHHDAIAAALNGSAPRCQPIMMEDTESEEVLWEIWIEGFEKARMLRPGLFDQAYGKPEAVDAYCRLLELAEIGRYESALAPKKVQKLTLKAHDAIGPYVDRLNATRRQGMPLRMDAAKPAPLPAFAGQTGRNDPCPCGSGRKYKKCCGLG